MTLRVSKNKNNPAFGLFKATLSKNIGSIVLLSLAMLIFCPGFFLAALSRSSFKASDYTSPEVLNVFFGFTVAVSCTVICTANYLNFSFLYKKSSSDVFHALPLTRGSLLFSRAAAGFTGLLIPVTIGYTALFLLSLHYPTFITGTFSQIASAYIVNVLLMLAFSAFSLIFIICAASAFDLIISFCGFNIAVLIIGGILGGLCDSYLMGYTSELYTGFFRVLSPIFSLAEKTVFFAENRYSLSESVGLILGITAYAVVFGAVCPILYRFRKAEKCEQAYAYRFLYVICGVLAGICGGYALSQIFIFAADTEVLSIIGFISFIAGALITTTVYGAVTDRGFKGIRRSIIIGIGSVVAYGLAAAIIITGAFGFENRIPSEKNVTAVTVSFDDVSVDMTNPKTAIALHKAILEKKADDNLNEIVDTPHCYVEINYNLSKKATAGNGDMIREYYVDKDKVKKELFAIYSSDSRFEDIEKNIAKVSRNLEVSGDYYESDDIISLGGKISKTELKKLISTYRRELLAAGESIFSAKMQEGIISNVTFSTDYEIDYHSFSIFTNDSFPETNKLLRQYEEIELEEKCGL